MVCKIASNSSTPKVIFLLHLNSMTGRNQDDVFPFLGDTYFPILLIPRDVNILSMGSGICINEVVSMINFEMLDTSFFELGGFISSPAVGVNNITFGNVFQNSIQERCSRAVENFNNEKFVCITANSSEDPLL